MVRLRVVAPPGWVNPKTDFWLPRRHAVPPNRPWVACLIVRGRRVLTQSTENQTLRLTAEFKTMKALYKLAVLIGLGILLPFAAFAKTPEEAYLEAAQKGPGVPVPVAVVSPSVSSDYAGTSVELKFTVDTKGTPTDLAVLSSPDAEVAKVIAKAVSQWRFKPALKNGAPVATKVVLPVRITSAGDNTYAAN